MRNLSSVGNAILLLFGFVSSLAAEDKILFRENFDKPLGDRWKQVKFQGATDYRIVTEGANSCLKAFAKGTCSAFATKVDLPSSNAITFSWRWKIDKCPKDAGDDVIETFDHAARVFIAFDTFVGPPRTINYVWANRVATNSVFEHPYSSRAQFIAIETGNTNTGKWIFERRNIQEDWNRVFKGVAMSKIVGVGVFTYSQTTKEPVTAWYSDIVLHEK